MNPLSRIVCAAMALLVPLYLILRKDVGADIAAYIVANILETVIGFIVMIAVWASFIFVVKSVAP